MKSCFEIVLPLSRYEMMCILKSIILNGKLAIKSIRMYGINMIYIIEDNIKHRNAAESGHPCTHQPGDPSGSQMQLHRFQETASEEEETEP